MQAMNEHSLVMPRGRQALSLIPATVPAFIINTRPTLINTYALQISS